MSKAKDLIVKEITDRLSEIALHFEERLKARNELRRFCGRDTAPGACPHLRRVIQRIFVEELGALYGLVHLKDNVTKFLNITGRSVSDLGVIEGLRLFRVAANFVNTHKHGARGKNAKSANADYVVHFFERKGGDASLDDPLIDVAHIINFEGELESAIDMALELLKLWEAFLRSKLQIDTSELCQRMNLLIEPNTSVYSTPWPDGIKKDARSLANERKSFPI